MSRCRALLATGVVVLAIIAAPAYAAGAEPDYEMPFPCKQKWTGSTRGSHTPSSRAVDLNRPNDTADPVTASALGTVTKVADLGRRSYGQYVVVDHGNGRSTLYAHLSRIWIAPGQAVDQGTVIGQVGGTGNVTGPHLHFEQRVGSGLVAAYFHAVKLAYGVRTASANCPDVPVVGDWNGDGKDEVGAYRRIPKSVFHRTGVASQRFGVRNDDPVVGDWDGNGTTDLAVRRGKTSRFLLAEPDGTTRDVGYGRLGDRPIAGDWDGDGKDELGVYRPATHQFLLRRADGATSAVVFGAKGRFAVTGDWNGDKRTDLGLFDPTTAVWTLRYADAAGAPTVLDVAFGTPGDLPVAGDWDGDGLANLGTWTPATATYSLRDGPASVPTTPTTAVVARRFGTPRL